ncbi:NAD(+) diphosphatase [Geotalea uraniireducens]|uniref:NAD(+) diphosphatase n=1 Tax=Geotalea uraniireducens (strain Rf4) TaxID=351605 RepID=A5G6P6_GEOUR|nr:NAD(+) diphosphatase [Geotalea uraniireducens]ABQ27464.1 NUDIX hydrolase [Geotalea uraniireducens Rf4]
MKYPDAVNLPFNAEIVKNGFTPIRPGERIPDGPGYWVILQGNAMVVKADGEQFTLYEGDLPHWFELKAEPLCFGLWQGKPIYTVVAGKDQQLPPSFVAEPFNAVEDRLGDRILTLGGLAHQIIYWERNSAICSRCGGEHERIPRTWGKRCKSCRHEHYPHIHPCIIVLVKRGDEFLLARKSIWPEGRYGLVAGFLDFGESLEECVHREVKEETGIEVKNLRYVGSQNWPFPSQLMAGFVADYAGGEITVDREELEDARWFCRDAMPAALPASRSIARWIIDTFALGEI